MLEQRMSEKVKKAAVTIQALQRGRSVRRTAAPAVPTEGNKLQAESAAVSIQTNSEDILLDGRQKMGST